MKCVIPRLLVGLAILVGTGCSENIGGDELTTAQIGRADAAELIPFGLNADVRSDLRRLSDQERDALRSEYSELRSELVEAFESSMSPSDKIMAAEAALSDDVSPLLTPYLEQWVAHRILSEAVLQSSDPDPQVVDRFLPLLLRHRNPDARLVKLSDVADISLTGGRYKVLHSGGRRIQTVTANVSGRDLQAFERQARDRIAGQVQLSPGNYMVMGGTAQAQRQAQADLVVHSLLAGIGIFLLLYIAFNNLHNLIITSVNLPFALIGGVIAVLATGGWLSLGSLVGFVTLFGITLRNSIMLVSHYQHLVEMEGCTWGPETALRGAAERLPSILMTALVTGLGLLPLALGSGEPGREIEGPMATIIVGGLATSTLLNLLVLPTLLLHFGRFSRPHT